MDVGEGDIMICKRCTLEFVECWKCPECGHCEVNAADRELDDNWILFKPRESKEPIVIMKMGPEDFRGRQGKIYPDDEKGFRGVFAATSSQSVSILEILTGKPWDSVALAYVHGFHPSCIRVTTGIMTCDAWHDRVTVIVDENNIIERIHQEIEVGLPPGVEHGSALRDALKCGLDSEQVRWHQDAEGYIYDGINGGYYKKSPDGLVPFPGTEEEINDENEST